MAENTKSVQWIPIGEVKTNPDNPREITEEDFNRLKKSIEDFPEMLTLRPLVVRNGIVLGGNMRLEALKQLGYKKAPVLVADELTDEQIKEFIIKDNVPFGKWDWEKLANEWESTDLNEWGLDVWEDKVEEEDFGDKNKEVNVDDMDDTMTITLAFTEEDYWKVKEGLSKVAQSPEQAVWKLLGNEGA